MRQLNKVMDKLSILYKIHDCIMDIMDAENVDVSSIPVDYKHYMQRIGDELADSLLAVLNNKNNKGQASE